LPTAVLRAFGAVEDLELDFRDDDRPSLVTALLARCAAGDEQYWWQQPVGTRIAALLQLLAVTDRSSRLELQARCTQAGCREMFEFELSLPSLVEQASTASPLEVLLDGQRRVSMRCATGEDLRRWRAAGPRSRHEAIATMIATLRIDGTVGPDDNLALAEAISARDPLVDFSVACDCPACGVMQSLPVDLEGVALRQLDARQRALLEDVHRLASRYGWTEAEVLAIAPSRRARYLALIDAER
jgi:hypothetical protein